LIAPSSGEVLIAGQRLTAQTGTSVRQRIGFLTETPGLWDRLTVRENLSVYAGLYGTAADIDMLLDTFGLLTHADARAAELSKGMRQKVAICRVLLHAPDVLLLDEPTSGLDPEVSRNVRALIDARRAHGSAILLSTHNLDEAERLADRVAVLQTRLVAVDTPQALRKRLATGRVTVRTATDAGEWLTTARGFDAAATAEAGTLRVALADADRDTPALVSALVAAGAAIIEVRPELPALEDVYLHLVEGSGH
jgi:ABC-2 type transport system ATP-binding protein